MISGEKDGVIAGTTPIPGADAFGGTTNVKTTNFALNGSYRINEQWSIGAGIDIIYGEGELKRTTTEYEGTKAQLTDVDASATTVGFNLGTVFEMDENNRFGLSLPL